MKTIYLSHSRGLVTSVNGSQEEIAAAAEVQGALDGNKVSQNGSDRYIDCPTIGRLVSHWSPREGWGGWHSKDHAVKVWDRDNP